MSTETKIDSKSEIQFNERTLEAFEKEGLDVPHGIIADKERYDKFKSKYKEEKGLQKIIKSISRRPIISFDEKGKAIKKDVLTYTTEYHGYDWLGNDLYIRDHIDGVYYKPKFRTTTTQDPETGDHIPKKEHDGITEEYYIELNEKDRKEIISSIIDKSSGTMIDNTNFIIMFPNLVKAGCLLDVINTRTINLSIVLWTN